ncbi:hypothetical protein NL108_012637 [Boleophthalmus pectinirostris]|nr:hypothetical protein NL108_012637 [Boleophthalmus pectinirostris]
MFSLIFPKLIEVVTMELPEKTQHETRAMERSLRRTVLEIMSGRILWISLEKVTFIDFKVMMKLIIKWKTATVTNLQRVKLMKMRIQLMRLCGVLRCPNKLSELYTRL